MIEESQGRFIFCLTINEPYIKIPFATYICRLRVLDSISLLIQNTHICAGIMMCALSFDYLCGRHVVTGGVGWILKTIVSANLF